MVLPCHLIYIRWKSERELCIDMNMSYEDDNVDVNQICKKKKKKNDKPAGKQANSIPIET